MPLPVPLKKVITEIDDSIEGYRAFINRHTGEFFGGDLDLTDEEDGDERLPASMKRTAARLRAVAASPDWLLVPDEFRCESVAEIERFCAASCGGTSDRALRAELQRGISLGLLKAKLGTLELYEGWEEFRRARMAELATAWLTANGIPFRE